MRAQSFTMGAVCVKLCGTFVQLRVHGFTKKKRNPLRFLFHFIPILKPYSFNHLLCADKASCSCTENVHSLGTGSNIYFSRLISSRRLANHLVTFQCHKFELNVFSARAKSPHTKFIALHGVRPHFQLYFVFCFLPLHALHLQLRVHPDQQKQRTHFVLPTRSILVQERKHLHDHRLEPPLSQRRLNAFTKVCPARLAHPAGEKNLPTDSL